MKLRYLLIGLLFVTNVFSQNYHDTQGKLQISNTGQATYTLPIAMPPSLQDVGPIINLNYVSGQMGGLAGQGWSINSISAITRISTKKDIDGFIDGVDFDNNDKLALDGQRLILKTGTYWSDGSVYETEVQSNTKIELVGSGASMYFVVTTPDGSKTWYGNYGAMNGIDLTAYYIVRFEDIKGNYMTYHYNKPTGVSLCIGEIRFSANINGITPQNKIRFLYDLAGRTENTFLNNIRHVKDLIIRKIEVYTSNLLFREYRLTYTRDLQLGYDKLTQIQEFNGALEPANPIVFEYKNTESTNLNSDTTKSYTNDIDFTSVATTGDFDGDGRLDFITNKDLFTKAFENTTGNAPLNVAYLDKKKFSITTLNSNKLNQFNSIVSVKPTATNSELIVYSLEGGVLNYKYTKALNLNNTFTTSATQVNELTTPSQIVIDQLLNFGYFTQTGNTFLYNLAINSLNSQNTQLLGCEDDIKLNGLKDSTEYLEGDYNGDGISEIIIVNSINEIHNQKTTTYPDPNYNNCKVTITADSYESFLLDMNPNTSAVLGSIGLINLNTDAFSHKHKKFVSDFNGDGKSDVMVIKDDKTYTVFSFKQLLNAPWIEMETIGNGSLNAYSKTKQILLGDYNGDAKTDVMLPDTEGGEGHTTWHIYYSNPNPLGGNFFYEETHNIVEYRPNTNGDYSTQVHVSSYYALDVNKDGKSDMVRVWRNRYKPSGTYNDHDTQWRVTSFINNTGNISLLYGAKFTPDYESPCVQLPFPDCNHTDGTPEISTPIASPFKYQGVNNELIMVNNHTNKITYIKFFKDVSEDILLKKVTSSGGNIVDEIFYKTMDTSTLNNDMGGLSEFYSSLNSLNYPFVELKKLPTFNLVSTIKNTTQGVVKSQDFRYHGYVANMAGLGAMGFNKTARSAWYSSPMAKRIWSVIENDNYLYRGAPLRSYSQLLNDGTAFSFVNSTSTLPLGVLNTTVSSFNYSTTNNVYKILVNNQITTDYLTNVSNIKQYTYDPLYLLPTKTVSKNLLSGVEQSSTTVDNEYDTNALGTGFNYYIGRPKRILTTVSAYSSAQTTEEKFTYTNNYLTKTEKKGATLDAVFITENFEYDIYGNIIKKTLSAPGSTPILVPRVTEYTYDASQRFVKTVKDVEGLISENISFDSLYGLVKESKNPFGLITQSFYDSWGKRIKITDYLGKSVDYTYTKSGTSYTTTETGQDGSSSVIIADALGRTIKTGSKNIDDTWSYVATEYDFLGRKFRVSEPYFGATPSLWELTEYDDYSRTIKSNAATGMITTISYLGLTVSASNSFKTTSSTKNANNHMVNATDPGGTINYTYYPNGSLKTSNYDGTILYMEYDGYGRKTLLSDPSAGIYKYKYTILGELLEEETPKGKTNYTYDNFGKLTNKVVTGLTVSESTNISTIYNYNSITKLLSSMTVINPNDGNSTYTYDYTLTDKRLWQTTETTPYATFIKQVTFDDFGRDWKISYSGTETSTSKNSTKKIKYSYKNGESWIISDDVSGQLLWQSSTVSERGQLKTGLYGNGIDVKNTYDAYGFPVQNKFDYLNNTVGAGGTIGSGEIVNIFTLDNAFNPQRGNLNLRSSSLFNTIETFEYDNLDRLLKWYSPSEVIQNLQFTTTVEGFTATTGAAIASVTGKLRITATPASAGAQKLVFTNAPIGTKFTVTATINKSTTDKIRVTIVEQNPTTLATIIVDLGLANEGAFSANYQVSTYKNIYLKFEKAATSIDVGVSKVFLVDNVVFTKINSDEQQYDNKGRITQSNIGNYTYNATKQYQNYRVALTPAGVEYYNLRQLQEVSYNAFKSPIRINEQGIDKINFAYNTFQNRSTMFYGGLQEDKLLRAKRKHYSADGSMEIKTNGTTIEFITYIGGDAYSAPVIFKSNGATAQEYLYLHRDYLGSIVAITNQAGAIVEKRHFDAWGNVAKVQDGAGNNLAGLTVIDRGYTSHEHLQSVGLIHMNGRLYDPKVHRFLQPDNFIQDPTNTQNYNRYGYVLNNPLKYSDPSGECIFAAILIGAGIAALTYSITALYADVPFSLGGLFQASLMGAISGAVTFGIGMVHLVYKI
ncbi:RHS repeat-associated core domain-containing protein [Flavobacterium sp.]|uniref:RHS repeat-associated core domain-containing protein n=1 Tax=Flavobacterium sp. TaxID=239 RepID=UPI003750A8E9